MTEDFSRYTDKGAIEKALKFPGIVVESKVRTWDDGKKSWEMTVFNVNTNKFLTDRVSLADPDSSSYVKTHHHKRLSAFWRLNVDTPSFEAIEGVMAQFDTEITPNRGYPDSVHYLPFKLDTRNIGPELSEYKERLQAERNKASTTTGAPTTKTITYDDETIDAMVGYLDGRDEVGSDVLSLGAATANSLRSGEGIAYLIGQGFISVDESGVYHTTNKV